MPAPANKKLTRKTPPRRVVVEVPLPVAAPIEREPAPLRELLEVLTSVQRGDFSVRMPVHHTGLEGKVADALNDIIENQARLLSELTHVSDAVGKEGKLSQRASSAGLKGGWAASIEATNELISDLVRPTNETARVIGAVARGDLTQTMATAIEGRELQGEFLRTSQVVNGMVERLSTFASEVTRVAREVGTEGKLGGQAVVKGVAGTWKDLTDSVNSMASNLTSQVRNIAEVTTAVANGDLSKKITVDVRGEILQLKDTINTMVDQLRTFAAEVTRVSREVGTEGKLGGQAVVLGVAGTWKDLTDSVNAMASNLTSQVRNIADVTKAVASGDLGKKISVDVRGEILELKDTINTMVDQLRAFASEVTRVAREVGTEGKLGGQARVPGVAGTWKDLTDNVNSMAENLTAQVRNIAEVTTAVANGDLSKKITVDVRGEILQLKDTINTMVDQLGSFASEVTRVAREVGSEGKLGGQASVPGVAGTWKDLTDNVNGLATNLTVQLRDVSKVATAIAKGDLGQMIMVDVKGEMLQIKDTINTMVEQLRAFASEVTRVAREVGTDGKLGGQAAVPGVAGTWKDLTDSVNVMASNLTNQVRNIAEVATAIANGNLSKKITVDVRGEILELKSTMNNMVDQLRAFGSEVTRVAREVGTEGALGGQAEVPGVAGTWKDLTDNVNSMASNLTSQVRNIAEIATAIANGDLSKKITVDVRGEILELKNTINTMVEQLRAFASEVTRVAREVGTDGKLGGQARVPGVAGTWKDLTDNVNSMAENLTTQVRSIAEVVTAVANGDLKRKLVLEAKGEIAELATTINGMNGTLDLFSEQVTTVAREVGIEGKLGGQARVPGAAGVWRDLTNNVNQLAENLTTQVRAIAEVSTAVTKGDLSRSITVDAEGEVAALKGNINQMILNLRETTQRNTEQDWLKTNLARFTRMLQGQRDLANVSQQVLAELAPMVNAQSGLFYLAEPDHPSDGPLLRLIGSYACDEASAQRTVRFGAGLVGQCAVSKQRILLRDFEEASVRIGTGLAQLKPRSIVVLPVIFEGTLKAVIELASVSTFTEVHLAFLEQLTESIGIVLNTIVATMQTEMFLRQSQALTRELQSQQEELTETNTRLSDQKAEVERGKRLLEDKAEQLALTSKYKSEFLANMSHELRTPLNSLLILSRILSENAEGNLTGKQVEYARTIYGSGNDLLELINDILDLSKIESGTMVIDVALMRLDSLNDFVERTFRQIAEGKKLGFTIKAAAALPDAMETEGKRLQQILKNLLSNAFKFTERGGVTLSISPVTSGWTADHEILNRAEQVIAFSVQDTGIGIPRDKHQVIFEAFQQADGTTNRKYGGTGLGLSISRELTRLLGGEIRIESEPGRGSTFTLYLPVRYAPAAAPRRRVETGSTERVLLKEERVREPRANEATVERELSDDRAQVQPGDKTLLIVEDDLDFAQILLDMGRLRGFRVITTARAEEALPLVKRYDVSAVTLDLHLPGRNGWTVLDSLKHDPQTRHVPVQIISVEDDTRRGLRLGALGHLHKPASKETIEQALTEIDALLKRPQRRLLLVEDDEVQRRNVCELLAGDDVQLTQVGSGDEALSALARERFDCVVLDLRLPDMSGFELLAKVQARPELQNLPVLVYTGKQLDEDETRQLSRLADKVILKDAHSPERLLHETALFLHRKRGSLPAWQQRVLDEMTGKEVSLAHKKVVIIDDDVRNIFALTSMLERYDMNVLHAENGKDGIALLEQNPDTDIVLMDVMMPEMDGFETTRAVRDIDRFKTLPIIAITAKAMKGDRERCIAAGASDYIAKPVDRDQLLSVMRVWLFD